MSTRHPTASLPPGNPEALDLADVGARYVPDEPIFPEPEMLDPEEEERHYAQYLANVAATDRGAA